MLDNTHIFTVSLTIGIVHIYYLLSMYTLSVLLSFLSILPLWARASRLNWKMKINDFFLFLSLHVCLEFMIPENMFLVYLLSYSLFACCFHFHFFFVIITNQIQLEKTVLSFTFYFFPYALQNFYGLLAVDFNLFARKTCNFTWAVCSVEKCKRNGNRGRAEEKICLKV